MSEPLRPWRDEAEAEGRAAELTRLAAEIPPRPVDIAKGWDDVIERVAHPRGSGRWLWASVAAAAGLALFTVLQRETPAAVPTQATVAAAPAAARTDLPAALPTRQDAPAVAGEEPAAPHAPAAPAVARRVKAQVAEAPSVPEQPAAAAPAEAQGDEQVPPPFVTPSAGALWARGEDEVLNLERGRIEVQPHAARVQLATPEVTLAATDARFLADVTENGTVVRVFEGEVTVVFRGESDRLRAGEEKQFAPVNTPSALDVVPPEASSPACVRQSLEQRLACLADEARGDGFRAQAALYERSYLLARAGRAPTAALTLRESLRRFPHGVLEPEVRLSLIKALMMQNRLPEAAAAAREFLSECEGDPRTTDVETFIRTLEWLQSR